MIFEVAQIDVKPGTEAEFEAGVAKARDLYERAAGYRSLELLRSIEKPTRYRLVIGWDTVEDHMVRFRESPDFQSWRGLVGACFDGPPQVEHVSMVLAGVMQP